MTDQQQTPNPAPPTSTPKEPAPKSWWGWIVAGFIAVGAVVGWFGGLADEISKLWQQRGVVLDLLTPDNTFKLRDVRKVSNGITGLTGHANDYEVLIEAVASKTSLKQCVADLDAGQAQSQGYYTAPDKVGQNDEQNGLERFTFYLPRLNFPDHGRLRVSCKNAISEWTNVDWPAELKTAVFQLCIGEHGDHCEGAIHLSCHTDPEGWAKTNHPDVCKYIKFYKTGSGDGNACGYDHYALTCSTAPIE
jgi:hypothetical protein